MLVLMAIRRMYGVVDEPGRRIVKEELASGGSALPWVDGIAFERRAIAMALADRAAVHSLYGWVFFNPVHTEICRGDRSTSEADRRV